MPDVEIQWDFDEPFIMDIEVASHETDRLGHTNNQVYLKWMEEISWLHIEPHGLPWSLQEKLGKSMAIPEQKLIMWPHPMCRISFNWPHGSPIVMAD